MSKKKLAFTAGLLVMVCGGVLQVLGHQDLAGISFFGISFVCWLLFREQLFLSKRGQTTSRQLEELRRDISGLRGVTRWYGTQLLDYGNSTYSRIKSINAQTSMGMTYQDTTEAHTAQKAVPPPIRDQPKPLRTGRAATPEVKNPNAEETLEKILNPDNHVLIAGVFDRDLVEGLKTESIKWLPSSVIASLERRRPDLVILDERYLDKGLWSGAFDASGTSQVSEVLDGIQWCNSKNVPIYLIQDDSVPKVHSHALREANVVVLPLKEEAEDQAFGAPNTPVLARSQALALEREN